jgi:hypothetical protein
MKKKLAVTILALSCQSAFAADLGAGVCKHSGLTEGVWWQKQFGFTGKLSAACVETQWNTAGTKGFSVGLAHLGYIHTNNISTINDTDEFHKTYTGGQCEGNTDSKRNCIARFVGRASEYGLTLGAFYGNGVISYEAGVLFYRSSFRMNVQRIDTVVGLPENVSQHFVGYHNTPYLGIVGRWNSVYVRFRVYTQIVQDGYLRGVEQQGSLPGGTYQMGLTKGPLAALTMGISF